MNSRVMIRGLSCLNTQALTMGLIMLLATGAWCDSLARKNKQGIKSFAEGKYDEAMTAFRDAQLEAPESPQIHFNIGDVLYNLKKFEEAQEEYLKAISTDDSQLQSQVFYNIGNAQYRMNKLVEAIDSYKKCLELNPDDMDAKYNLEFVRKKLKESAQQQQQNQKQQDQQQQQGQEQQPQDAEQQQQQQAQQKQGDQGQDQQAQQQQQGEEQQQQPMQQQASQDQQGAEQEQGEKKQGEMSKAEAQQILDALKNDEENVQKEMRRMRQSGQRRVDKDW